MLPWMTAPTWRFENKYGDVIIATDDPNLRLNLPPGEAVIFARTGGLESDELWVRWSDVATSPAPATDITAHIPWYRELSYEEQTFVNAVLLAAYFRRTRWQKESPSKRKPRKRHVSSPNDPLS